MAEPDRPENGKDGGQGPDPAPEQPREAAGTGAAGPEAGAPGPAAGGETKATGAAAGPEGKGREERKESKLRSWVDLVVRAGFWALAIYLFVFQVSVVHGRSMQPNFETDDRLVIDKITYRVKDIRRFDVVVFEAVVYEPDTGRHVRKDFIKRVIGLGGETVTIRGGRIYVDGEPLQEDERTFGYLSAYDEGEWKIPEGRYFVLGDNRSVSKDSRKHIGLVAYTQIKGKVRLRFAPWERMQWY